MTVRKAKHSPLTETAWKHFKAQVVKSGLSVQQAVELCATRGWISINADWQAVKDYEKETDSRSSMPPRPQIPYEETPRPLSRVGPFARMVFICIVFQ